MSDKDTIFTIIKKSDIALFFAIVIVGLGLTFWGFSADKPGDTVLIKIKGEEFGRYSLHEDKVITLKDHGNINKVVIKDGTVKMESASCDNQNCVEQGSIEKTSQSIVCLPNKVTVEVVGGDGVDSISQ